MDKKFCIECGHEITPETKFCTSCGEPQRSSLDPSADRDEYGPLSLPMPDGQESIRLNGYHGNERAKAITIINSLTTAQREVWVAAGQPDILLWPGGDFATWLGAIAPQHYRAAKEAEQHSMGNLPPRDALKEPTSNPMATAGFVLSLVSLVTFFLVVPQLLGLIFGIIGAAKATEHERRGESPKGKGLAVAAISVSSVIIFTSLVAVGVNW